VRSIRGVFKGLHEGFVDALMHHARLGTPRVFSDARAPGEGVDTGMMTLTTAAAAVEVHYLVQVPHKVGVAFDKMSPGLTKATRVMAQWTMRGITPTEQGIADVVAHAREENIRLIEVAGRAYAKDVRGVFDDPANYDLSPSALRQLLVERGNVSMSRADLIARDQVLKLGAAMNMTRQLNAGVTEYLWSGVMDKRERRTHVRMEGRRCSWSSRPEPLGYHPGEDYQCRCIALAYVPELDNDAR
jgi:SPP1 gp7 family putative phage head morphogenesis protein